MDCGIACNMKCSDDVYCYNSGIIGKNYDIARIMIILNRSDSRALRKPDELAFNDITPEEYYGRALWKSDTGRILSRILDDCKLSRDDLYITNAFKCLLPRDREPRIKEYSACIEHLKEQIQIVNPKKIILFGQKPYRTLFENKDNGELFILYESFNDIPVLALNHPRKIHDLKSEDKQRYLESIAKFLKA